MKKQLWKRLCAGLLAAVLLVSLCACGGKKTETAAESGAESAAAPDRTGVEKVTLDHVYKMEYLDVPESENGWNLSGGPNGVYLTDYYFEELTDADGYYTGYRAGNRLYSLDPDTCAVTLVRDFPESSSMDETPCVNDYSSYQAFTGVGDGTLWCARQDTHEDWSDENNYIYETSASLVHLDAQGQELAVIPLEISGVEESDYVYISGLLAAEDGSLVVEASCNSSYLLIYSPEGKLVCQKTLDGNEWIQNQCLTSDGRLVAWISGYDEVTYESRDALYAFDLSTGEQTELADVPLDYITSLLTGPDDTLLMQDSNGVYSFDPATGTLTEILNWLNSDINGSRLSSLVSLGDGTFLVTEYTVDYDSSRLARLTPVGTTTEKYVLTLAATYLDDNLRQAIIDFNKQNDEYRITYVDYSVYNTEETDYMGGYDQLSRDIVSGNVPDIISLQNLSVSTFASRGILADLSAMMEADSEFNQSDYLENVLNASQYQGKTVSLIPSFYLGTMAVNPDYVSTEGGWTLDSLKALAEQYPDSSLLEDTYTQSSFLNSVGQAILSQYMDLDAGTCNFTDPSFVTFLELMGTFPEEIDWEEYEQRYNDSDYWETQDAQYRTGKVLINIQYLYDFSTIRELLWSFGGDFDLVGYPSTTGTGTHMIVTNMELGISASSKMQDVAWEFFKYLLSYDFQSQISWSIPINRQAIEDKIAEAIPSPYGEDYEATIDSTAGEAEIDYYGVALTEEQVAKVRAALESASVVDRSYEEINTIISEEASSYFSGQKTAQAAADIIQSRVSIYLSENS